MIGRENGERLIFLLASEVELIREGLGHLPAKRVWHLMAKLAHQQDVPVAVTPGQTAEIEAILGPATQLARWESYETRGAWERRA